MENQNLFGIVMGICFGYSLLDVLLTDSEDCMMPMQRWLVISYVNIAVFRGSQKLGQRYSDKGENFIFSFRHQSLLPRLVTIFTWCILVPFFATWTVLGTVWLRLASVSAHSEESDCVSDGTQPHLILFWQLLSYVWISIYVVYFVIACVVEYRLRKAESNVRIIQSSESIERWGRVGPAVTNTLAALQAQTGLQPAEIQALPSMEVQVGHDMGCEMHCPICLCDFCPGDKIRGLPKCGHHFHQSCIDLWLLRRAECPMCKGAVQQ